MSVEAQVIEGRAIEVWPVAVVRSTRTDPIDDEWGDLEADIELLAPFGPEAWSGLEEFSHVEVVFHFHRVDPAAVHTGVRRPRGRPEWPEVGIFAQRAKDRPNRIGLSVCEVVSVTGTTLRVRGLDAIDATPVLDVKPYFVEFGPRGPQRQPAWAGELMTRYFS